MAEYRLPEFDDAIQRTLSLFDEWLEDLHDFNEALFAAETPQEFVDEYRSRRLLRQLPDDTVSN